MKTKKCAIISSENNQLGIERFGQEEASTNSSFWLRQEMIKQVKEKGVTHFISGTECGVELDAAEIAIGLKAEYPELIVECVIPYETQAEFWSEENRDRYFRIIESCDKEIMLQKHFSLDAINRSKKWITEQSEVTLLIGANGRYVVMANNTR